MEGGHLHRVLEIPEGGLDTPPQAVELLEVVGGVF